MGYEIVVVPPFLKDLRDKLDSIGFDWDSYKLYGMVGGEGMTEALRDYCEQRFIRVLSGYGASDLTIGIGGESRLTVWLRDQIVRDEAFKEALLGEGESRIPMIFQYNPLETYLETNDKDELLCTLNSTTVLSPKLRYNIGDEAKLLTFPGLEALIAKRPDLESGFREAQSIDRMKLPILLLYGRADSTVSFMGAGLLTTVAGLGGGILMLLAVSLATDPKVALVATAPALLAGNLHRAFLFRGDVDRRVARAFALGAFPGSVLGGALLFSAHAPPGSGITVDRPAIADLYFSADELSLIHI